MNRSKIEARVVSAQALGLLDALDQSRASLLARFESVEEVQKKVDEMAAKLEPIFAGVSVDLIMWATAALQRACIDQVKTMREESQKWQSTKSSRLPN